MTVLRVTSDSYNVCPVKSGEVEPIKIAVVKNVCFEVK